MITIRDFMECVNYRITEGSDYGWSSFGPKAYRLDSWDGDQEGVTVGIIFDTETQLVYQMEAHDYTGRRSYRWTHPDYIDAYKKEAKEKLRSEYRDMAYDEVPYTELDVAKDILSKARAMIRYEPYDTRVQVPIELDDTEIFYLMKLAHEKDITLNQLVEQLLNEVIKKEKQF